MCRQCEGVFILCFIRSLVAIFINSLCPSPSCISLAYEPDEGLDEWTEDVFESQVRLPLSSWPGEDKSYWSDIVSSTVHILWMVDVEKRTGMIKVYCR